MPTGTVTLPAVKRPPWLWLKLLALALALIGLVMLRVPGAVREYVYVLFREIVRGQVILSTRNMDTISDQHFLIRYEPSDAADARMILHTADKFYAPVTRDFGLRIGQRIPIIVYPTRASLNASFGWPASESAMGVYWAGVIRVLSPRAWVASDDPGEIKEAFESSGPVAHEMTHLVVDYITRGNVPRWLTEGLAQAEEKKLTGFRFDSPQGSLAQPLYHLAEMDRGFDQLPNQALAYRESLSAVDYMKKVYGDQAVHNILRVLGTGRDINRAMQSALGVDLKQFEQRWRQSIGH
ncbi:peptidase MA family metallohydrolase [Desulfotomaculum copahuensis]|uniref:Peptidase MA-like domain-containing protein n=1 Tax=Desulfotomaculum copahuensis TaxID=1838280 RepID=A0A1B7LD49_9FIRM|nr:peptidase MA family metallohydrolase [Desulfotomaculum copahuensis]OAT80842.1 hypothetical protein A6M21_12270 [Desulfotomaculum copahuensis]